MPRPRLIAAALALSLLPLLARPAGAEPTRTERIFSVFAQTCLQRPNDPEGLKALMASDATPDLPRLPDETANLLATGGSGAAWALPASLGETPILAQADDGMCAIYVVRLGEPDVAAQLGRLFGAVESQLFRIVKLEERQKDTRLQTMWGFYPQGRLAAEVEARGRDVEQPFLRAVLSHNPDEQAAVEFVLMLYAEEDE